MHLPDTLLTLLKALRAVGRPRLVGGCVRDHLLGLTPGDFDIEVPGADFDALLRVLHPFGPTDVVGRSFGVIKVRVGGVTYDVSLPRRESKTGAGHRGFRVEPDPGLSDAEAAARRDFTVNAMAWDPFGQGLIDPLGGEADLKAGVLRHAGPGFGEDPLRALRAFQFAARFAMRLAPETALVCRSMVGTFAELPVERIWGEWAKWAGLGRHPGRGLSVLAEAGWEVCFPELAALRGVPQDPEWHPEGDVWVHTLHACDALVRLPGWEALPAERREVLLLAVLAHDFGKPSTTAQTEKRGALRWTSPGHEKAGGPPAGAFLARIGAPPAVTARVRPLVENHMAPQASAGPLSDTALRRLARRLSPANLDDLAWVMRADTNGRPPLTSPGTHALIDDMLARARDLALRDAAPRPLLLGRHLIAAGLAPGPTFTPLLDEAFEAQLDGAFSDEAGATAWLRSRLTGS